MKKLCFLMTLVFLTARVVLAQLNITSFNQNGRLTWTNIVSNAQYRVEWSGSVTGAWQSFDALTNLNLISATNNSVTVQVPTFYRVVWLNPPAPEPNGVWDYRAYDNQNGLLVTGRLSLTYQTNQIDTLTGTRNFQWTGNNTTNNGFWTLQLGTGTVRGNLSGHDVYLNLNPSTSDENIVLRGKMIGVYLSGIWAFHGFGGGEELMGTFNATKVTAPKPQQLPSAQPKEAKICPVEE